jgi:lysophospholipase L1-like esterase
MRILFYGDSITDAGRNRDAAITNIAALGYGYVRVVADRLIGKNPEKYEVINRGISGNRIVDLYSRIKVDAWNLEPDVMSILIGINDIWHEVALKNGVEIDRFENVYRMLIKDTLKALPNVKLILCEPFVLEGSATKNTEDLPDKYERFCEVYKYAEVVKKLAKEFNVPFVPLQERFNEEAKKSKVEYYLMDGVHPNVAGATLIADEWVKTFEKEF